MKNLHEQTPLTIGKAKPELEAKALRMARPAQRSKAQPTGANLADVTITTGLQAHDFVVTGMPGRVLDEFVRTVVHVPTKALLQAIGVSERTAQRIKTQPTKLLDSKTSDGVLKVASIRALAADVLGSTEAAEEWMNAEAMGLEFRKPIDLLSSTPGVEMVRTLLRRMREGVYT